MIKEYLGYKRAKNFMEKIESLGTFAKVSIVEDKYEKNLKITIASCWLDNAEFPELIKLIVEESVKFNLNFCSIHHCGDLEINVRVK